MTVDSFAQVSTRRTVFLLACCQALSMASNSVLFSAGALIGKTLAPLEGMATLPLALLHVATMSATLPTAILMQRMGRQWAFILGAVLAFTGVGLGIYSVFVASFLSFCLATIVFGTFNACIAHYRFAAAEIADEHFRSQAISLVVSGGVFAALVGPPLAAWTKDLFPTAEFAGSLSSILLLLSLVIGLLSQVRLSPLEVPAQQETGRPLWQIMQQPTFIVAVLGSMLGYGVMVLVMTATPLAMSDRFSFGQTAFVIQWHVLGMFGPSFVTGSLIARFGVLKIIQIGGLLNLLCFATNLLGQGLGHYWFSLLVLGIGWNFMFVGSTTLLTETYTVAERAKTQAVHDFLMFGCVALSALGSGGMLNSLGWRGVNWAGLPMIWVAMVAVFLLSWRWRSRVASKLP